MDASDFVLLHEDRLFVTGNHQTWLEVVMDLLTLIEPHRDEKIEQLKEDLFAGDAARVRSEILRLHGPGFWRDESPSGRKYRVLNAMATSEAEAIADPET